jgi:hypothetical protein
MSLKYKCCAILSHSLTPFIIYRYDSWGIFGEWLASLSTKRLLFYPLKI